MVIQKLRIVAFEYAAEIVPEVVPAKVTILPPWMQVIEAECDFSMADDEHTWTEGTHSTAPTVETATLTAADEIAAAQLASELCGEEFDDPAID